MRRKNQPTHEVTYFDVRPDARHGKKRRIPRQVPLPAKIGAAVLISGVVLGTVLGIGAAQRAGQEYDACIQKIAQELGHDAAQYEMKQGACTE